MFPSDSDYIIRVCKAEFGQSKSSGNPMITVEFEVVAPETKEVAGQEVVFSGAKTTQYYPTTVFDGNDIDTEKTKSARKRLFNTNPNDTENPGLYNLIGLTESPDFENPDTKVLLGKAFYAQLYDDAKSQRKEPTMAQVEAARAKNLKPEGDIMKHPVTGKELVTHWPKLKTLFAANPENSVEMAY